VTTVEAVIAISAALGAACAFGVGVALQHRQVQLAPMTGRAPFRLLAHLARRRLWLAGLALAAAAYGLQALALAFGPLALVAPVAAMDLLFAIPAAARWSRQPMRAADWAGCALAAGGVAIFLAAAPPSAGRPDAPAGQWALAFAAVALVCVAMVVAGALTGGATRAALLAAAAGTVFGLTAALTLSLARLLRGDSQLVIFGHWQLWALVALGTVGLLLSATAFEAGALTVSLPVIDTVEPVTAVLIGTAVFGERLATFPAGLAVQLGAAATALAGIIVLGRSPMAARAYSYAPLGGMMPAGNPHEPRPAPRPGATRRSAVEQGPEPFSSTGFYELSDPQDRPGEPRAAGAATWNG
jgi:drug/metabolite transporter (DMT)-like permease